MSWLPIAFHLFTLAVAAPSTPENMSGVDLKLPGGAFGAAIEGAAVDAQGNIFAADFTRDAAAASNTFAILNQVDGGTTKILDKNINPFFNLPQGGLSKLPLIAGARFLSSGRVLLADAANQRVLSAKGADVFTICSDVRMLQPNDIAISTQRETLIYLSGQNFSSDTTAGVSGDLWTCDNGKASQVTSDILAGAGIHRTNGIETSPDGQSLYLSSAKNVKGAVVENRIYRFQTDKLTGALLKQPPTVFYEFTGVDAAVDIDGMRTDVEGNLFVSRNGKGQVVKISPQGKLLMVISLPGMGGPSNLELGGVKGKTLFAIGKCLANKTVGCAVSIELDTVGKAFSALQKKT